MGGTYGHPIEKVLVIGNQYLSRTIVTSLNATRNYQITILTYPNQELDLPPKNNVLEITQKTTDFKLASLQNQLQGQDLVISTIAQGDQDLQKRIIDACISASVPRFIPNEFGYDSHNLAIQDRLPAYKAKAAVLSHLISLQSSLEWIGIAVGCILDHELQTGKIGFDLKWHSASLAGRGAELFPVASLARVGDLVSKLIQKWDGVKNTYIYANGCTTSANQVVEILQYATKSQWVVHFSDPNDLMREAERRLSSGFPDAAWTLLERNVLFDREVGLVRKFLAHSINGELGLEAEKVEDIVRKAVHEWEHSTHGDCGCS